MRLCLARCQKNALYQATDVAFCLSARQNTAHCHGPSASSCPLCLEGSTQAPVVLHKHCAITTWKNVLRCITSTSECCLPRTLDRKSSERPHSYQDQPGPTRSTSLPLLHSKSTETCWIWTGCQARLSPHHQVGAQTTTKSSGRNGGNLWMC